MRWAWHDADGSYVYDSCEVCMWVGRLVHVGVTGGRRVLVDIPCAHCAGLGYLAETRRPCDEDGPRDDAPSPETLAVRAHASWAGCCPDCLGYGRRIVTVEDEWGRTVIVDQPACTSCGGTGTSRRRA